MTLLLEIPALGCDEGLYETFNAALGLETKVVVASGSRMDACVDQVLAQAPKEFFLLGTSFGGRVALETAVASPERVKVLIIIGAGAGPVVDQAAGLKRSERVRGTEFEVVLKEMGDIVSHLPGPRGPETMEAFRAMSRKGGPERFALQSDAMAHRTDLWPLLSKITCPVLCLWGEHDQYSPAETAMKIATSVPRGTAVLIKDCGHFPTLEYPEETARSVAGFLSISG
ncbi:alpha/beta fold hydrolase [Aestuariivirga litoralis]|uniref:alpha/beta fold hydrolase n=1 Tax=Aestuariivirga litoralis TaxID=2650924 RepID=UPI0018C7BEDE|nr:alpha/beta hydrolase [Aestuariivirga litoralis]MBG1232788.1 alpha/beta hydrolase [Aestuariivirga litoralis]